MLPHFSTHGYPPFVFVIISDSSSIKKDVPFLQKDTFSFLLFQNAVLHLSRY